MTLLHKQRKYENMKPQEEQETMLNRNKQRETNKPQTNNEKQIKTRNN